MLKCSNWSCPFISYTKTEFLHIPPKWLGPPEWLGQPLQDDDSAASVGGNVTVLPVVEVRHGRTGTGKNVVLPD